jgi:hypothetical protein
VRGPAIRAGLRYGLEAFALGFGLGIFRTLVVAPALGETVAVLIELPVLLSVMILRARAISCGARLPSPPGSAIWSWARRGSAC